MKKIKKEFEDRVLEIKNYLSKQGDVERATKRLMDLAKDYGGEENEVLGLHIRAQYRSLHKDRKLTGVISEQDYSLGIQNNITACLELLQLIKDYFFKHVYVKYRKEQDPITDEHKEIVLAAHEIEKEYPNFKLTVGDLVLKQGEIIALVGRNASGKSTLLKMLAGRIPVSNGVLNYIGYETGQWFDIKQNIAYVPQELPEWIMPCRQVLEWFAAIRGFSEDKINVTIQKIIYRLGLENYLENSWKELSGGYKTRFEMARSLLWNPGILILDEPLAHLDPDTQMLVLEDIRDLAKSLKHPIAVIISSQHISEVELIADNVIFLENGVVKYNGIKSGINTSFEYHAIEIKTNSTKEDVAKLLKTLDGRIDTDNFGMFLRISFPSDILAETIFAFLVEQGIFINEYKNISTSSKRFF